jgi:ribonuclease HII
MAEPLTIGVDEVGRGPLAGPVVACACHLPPTLQAPWVAMLADSKTLSIRQREFLAQQLQQVPHAIAAASVAEIDTLNIRHASLLAMQRAVIALAAQLKLPHAALQVMVDGNVPIPAISYPQTTVVRGDATVPCISAASILAKVFRDALMRGLHAQYPHYGWQQNAGYGSAAHLAALQQFGATPHHRASFAPVRATLAKVPHAA